MLGQVIVKENTVRRPNVSGTCKAQEHYKMVWVQFGEERICLAFTSGDWQRCVDRGNANPHCWPTYE